ncbi:MAG TPA: hypothetical protein VNZ44_02980 [Pyrinomonadaceae bacterium]|nr:hypothetical protein [Pyrinomonadaceae bacterium]
MTNRKPTMKGGGKGAGGSKGKGHASTAPTVPTVDYEPIIRTRAAEVTSRINLKKLDPQYRTEEHRALLHAQHLESQRERFRDYQVLANHFADVLESEDTPAEVHNALLLELDDLSNRSGVMLTSPEVLRIIYPLMRDRLFEKEAR